MAATVDILTSIKSSPDIDAVAAAFRTAIHEHGFSASACGYFRITRQGPTPHFYFQDWPENWLKLYMAEDFVHHDFGVAEARSRREPFTWSEAKAVRVLSRGEKRIWQAVLDFGWKDGFSVPVHGPGGYFGLVAMAGAKMELPVALRLHLEAIALAAHDRCAALTQRGGIGEQDDELTSRELQCLRWVAAGAQDAATAAHLGISSTTVKEYVASARRKLNARSRAQAVAILAALGML